jgi:hypothetical protein
VADSALDLLNGCARRRNAPGVIAYAGLNAGHPVVEFVMRLPARPARNICLAGGDGTLRPVQVLKVEELRIVHTNATVNCYEARCVAHLPGLKPGEVRRLSPATGRPAPPANPVRVAGRILENGLLRVAVNPDGTLDLSAPRTGRTLPGIHYFTQEADLGGGYHFQPLDGDTRRDTRGGRARVRRLAAGPLRGSLEVQARLAVPSYYDRIKQKRSGRAVITLTSTLTLEADSDVLKITTVIDNPAGNQRVRLVLPTGMAGAKVNADASFAVHANSPERWPADPRQNFHPMRSFVDIADATGGLAFLGRGQHEYEIVPKPEGTDIEVTLLRSVDFVFLCSTWETPGAQLRGRLTHDYALRLHPGDWRTGRVAESAAAFLNPAVATVSGDSLHPHEDQDHATVGFYAKRRGGVEIPVDTNRSPWHATNAHRDGWRRIESDRFLDVSIPERIVPFTLEGDHLVVSAFKRAEDGRGEILRFWSAAETEQSATIRGGDAGTRISKVNLLEQPITETGDGKGSLTLRVRPFEIVTVRVEGARP